MKAVLVAIDDFARGKQDAWPSIATLAAQTSMSEAAVKRAIRGLQLLGLLNVWRRKNANGTTSNHYAIMWQNLMSQEHSSPAPVLAAPSIARSRPGDANASDQRVSLIPCPTDQGVSLTDQGVSLTDQGVSLTPKPYRTDQETTGRPAGWPEAMEFLGRDFDRPDAICRQARERGLSPEETIAAAAAALAAVRLPLNAARIARSVDSRGRRGSPVRVAGYFVAHGTWPIEGLVTDVARETQSPAVRERLREFVALLERTGNYDRPTIADMVRKRFPADACAAEGFSVAVAAREPGR